MSRAAAALLTGGLSVWVCAQAPLPKFKVTVIDPLADTGSFYATGISDGGEIFGTSRSYSSFDLSYGTIVTRDTVRVLPRINSWSPYETVLGIDADGRIFGRSRREATSLSDLDEDWVIEPGATVAKPLGFQFAGVNRSGTVAGNRGQETVTWKSGTIRSTFRHQNPRATALGIADDGTVSGIDPGQWVLRNGALTPLPGLLDTVHSGITPSGRLFGSSFYQYGQGYTYSIDSGLKYYNFPVPISYGTFFDRDLPYVVASDQLDQPWIHINGQAIKVSGLLANPSDGIAGRVRGVNSRGQILVERASLLFVAEPVPEPATMTALAVGALALVRKRRKA